MISNLQVILLCIEVQSLEGYSVKMSIEDSAKFRIVKLAGTSLSDNEIKPKSDTTFLTTISQIRNWDFGETFYFTELASYVHRQLGSPNR